VGAEVFLPPTDDPCNGYIYGRQFFYLMTRLNVGEGLSTLFAVIFAISFVVIAAGIIAIQPNSKKSTILGLLVFFSPSCWLLVERMNLDLLILLLLVISVLLIRIDKPMVAIVAILISAFIKFYTFPLAVLTVLFIRSGRIKLYASFIIFLAGLILASEIIKIPRFPGTWYVSFGNQVIGQWWNLLISEKNLSWPEAGTITSSIAGALLILTCMLICRRLSGNSAKLISLALGEKLINRDLNAIIYIYSSALLFICFFAGMNYDYRLFYLGISSLMIYKTIPSELLLKKVLIAISLVSLWASCFFYGLQGIRVVALELAGDVFTGIAVSLNLLLCLHIVINLTQLSESNFEWKVRR
jgi:hypothetical protein